MFECVYMTNETMGGADKRVGLGEVLHAASRIVCIHSVIVKQ